MKALPTRYPISRTDIGLGMGRTAAGIMVEVYREEFSVDVDGRVLFAKIEVPRHKGAIDFKATREREAENAMNVMALKVSAEKGKSFVLKKSAKGAYLEEDPGAAPPGLPPLKGVELILVRGLVHTIHAQHPKWPRERVSETAALARIGRGPYAGEWARMTARGPSQGDVDDTPAVGS